jgi:ureidoacrylate peracid hydrolase
MTRARASTVTAPTRLLGRGANAWRVSDTEADLSRGAGDDAVVALAARPQRLIVDPAIAAVVVIDMQNDFCAAGGWVDATGGDHTAGRRAIEPIKRTLARARELRMRVVWLNWGNRPDLLNVGPSTLHSFDPAGTGTGLGAALATGRGRVLTAGDWTAATIDELRAAPDDIAVSKYRTSGFWGTELDQILRNLGVKTLFFTGVNTDQCVDLTLRDAYCLDYDCILVADGTATTSPQFAYDATLWNVEHSWGFVTTSTDIDRAQRGREA